MFYLQKLELVSDSLFAVIFVFRVLLVIELKEFIDLRPFISI